MAKALQLLGFVNLKDIANACIYLLSDASRRVTGSNLWWTEGIRRGEVGTQKACFFEHILTRIERMFFAMGLQNSVGIGGIHVREE